MNGRCFRKNETETNGCSVFKTRQQAENESVAHMKIPPRTNSLEHTMTPHDAFVGACFDQRQHWRHFMADSGGVVVKTYESETGSLTSYNTQRKSPRPPETKLFLVSTKIPFYDLPGDEGIV